MLQGIRHNNSDNKQTPVQKNSKDLHFQKIYSKSNSLCEKNVTNLNNQNNGSNGSNSKIVIQMRKNATINSSSGSSKIIVDTGHKKITFNLKSEKSFFKTICHDKNFQKFKEKIIQLEEDSENISKSKGHITPIDANIDLSSLEINDDGQDFIPSSRMNKNLNVNTSNVKSAFGTDIAYNVKNICGSAQTNEKNEIPSNANLKKCLTASPCLEMLKSQHEASLIQQSHENLLKEDFDNNLCNKESRHIQWWGGKEGSPGRTIKEKEDCIGYVKNEIVTMKNPLHLAENIANEAEKNNNNNSNLPIYTALNFEICVICDLYITKKNMLVLEQCKHTFCSKCCKHFYEEKIEEGEQEMACPMYSCRMPVNKETFIKGLVSQKHYEKLKYKNEKPTEVNSNMNTHTYSSLGINAMSLNTIMNLHGENVQLKQRYMSTFGSTRKQRSTIYDTLKKYTHKNVIDVSNNDDSYLFFRRFKEQFCQICSNPSLYGRLNGNMMKCLNCFNTFCKFCFERANMEHFDQMSKNYCKIYSKKKTSLKQERGPNFSESAASKFLKNFGIASFSYCLLFCYFFFILGKFVEWILCLTKNEKKRKHFHFLENDKTLTNFPRLGGSIHIYNKKKPKKKKIKLRILFQLRRLLALMIKTGLLVFAMLVFIMILPYYPMISIICNKI